MSLSLKDKWVNSLSRGTASKHSMDKSLVSFLNHRDIFDINDLKSKLPTIKNLKYDKSPIITALNSKNK